MDKVWVQMHLKLFATMAIWFALCISPYANADVTVIQALDFGSYIVKRNNAQYDITVNPGGVCYYSSTGFIEISPCQGGIYDIDGLQVSSVIASVVVTQIDPLQGVTGEVFQMVNGQASFGSTNGSGVARIRVGATARTSGNGNPYASQNFLGTLQIQINF